MINTSDNFCDFFPSFRFFLEYKLIQKNSIFNIFLYRETKTEIKKKGKFYS